MAKRLKLQCWNCPNVYFYTLENASQQEIIVSCPFCKAEAVVDLRSAPTSFWDVYKGDEDNDWPVDEDDVILPTKKRI